MRLKGILQRGLTATAPLGPTVRVAYGWVHQAARLLTHEAQHPGAAVKRRRRGLLGAMTRHQAAAGTLAPALGHFLKVSRSYWPGLFHGSEVAELPRTNHDLEQCFGAPRDHERRATGRKGASPALVLSGSIRLVAATATRRPRFSAGEIAPETLDAWRNLRHELAIQRRQRTLRRRFRHAPISDLAQREADLLKLSLPP